MKVKIDIVLVIYNRELTSCSITEFVPSADVKILVTDNSTYENVKKRNKEICATLGFCYIDMQGNQGLAKAYNKCISIIRKENCVDNIKEFFLFLDQDTYLKQESLFLYFEAIKKNPKKLIFCPIVYDSVGVMSPSLTKGMKFIHEKKYNSSNNRESISNYSFINSGMCVALSVYENIHYDEHLFLDMVDHDFIKCIKKSFADINPVFIIEDLILQQQFSGVSKNSFESDKIRFQIYYKDSNYYCLKWYGRNNTKTLFFRAVKLSLQHKNSFFIKYFLEKMR